MRKKKPHGALSGLTQQFFTGWYNAFELEPPSPSSAIDTPMDYTIGDVDEFRDAYWLSESWAKYPFELPGVNREATAYGKFFAAEEECRHANSVLVDWQSRVGLDVSALRFARQAVHDVLGRFDWDSCYRFFSFGPGATTSIPRRNADHANKWENGAHITAQCVPLFLAFCQYTGWRPSFDLIVVDGNRVTTVPKSAKTDRVIAIEPDWNMFFQRGIGAAIRRRLQSRLGLLLPHSQSLHHDLARQASLSGELATIDLSSASDSISLALAEALLPSDWFRAMCLTRSRRGVVGDRPVEYEKISSMGNGYTFELETLLFWALAKAKVRYGLVSVYGDDIIVPVDRAEGVITLLQEVGFTVNAKKTFTAGPFRESCGGHFYLGHDVTPPYFKKPLDSRPEIISAANAISRTVSQRYYGMRDGRFEKCHSLLSRSVGPFLGPIELGDTCLHTSREEAYKRGVLRFSKRTQTVTVPTIRYSTVSRRRDVYGGVWANLWGRGGEHSEYDRKGKLVCGRSRVYGWTAPMDWLRV